MPIAASASIPSNTAYAVSNINIVIFSAVLSVLSGRFGFCFAPPPSGSIATQREPRVSR